jgi:hypothetical protein
MTTTTAAAAAIVTTWMQKPQRYTINVPLYYLDVQQQLFLGLQFMTNESTHLLVVTAFAPHPLTQRPTWIERTGRVQLMDQLVSVNGLSGRDMTLKALVEELKKEMARAPTTRSTSLSSSTSSSSSLSAKFLAIASGGDTDAGGDEPCLVTKVRMEFESAYLQVISYRCPRCADSIVVDTTLLNQMSRHFEGCDGRQQYSDTGMPLTTEPPFQFQCSNCRQMLSVTEYPTTFVTPSTSGKDEEAAPFRPRK